MVVWRVCAVISTLLLQSRSLVVDSLLENVNKPANNVTLSIGVWLSRGRGRSSQHSRCMGARNSIQFISRSHQLKHRKTYNNKTDDATGMACTGHKATNVQPY